MCRAANGFPLKEERICRGSSGGFMGEEVKFHAVDLRVGREEVQQMKGLSRGNCGADGDECNSAAASVERRGESKKWGQMPHAGTWKEGYVHWSNGRVCLHSFRLGVSNLGCSNPYSCFRYSILRVKS